MRNTEHSKDGRAGFSLVELMVAMVLVLIIMGGALTSLRDAYRSNESAKAITGLNNNLRIGIDLIVRDFIQVGQGLPTARVIQVPNGAGAARIQRPHPQGSPVVSASGIECTQWPAGTTTIPAVTPGPGCGPTINGAITDTVTTLAVDSMLDGFSVQNFNDTDPATGATATTATIAIPAVANGGSPVAVGDLMMFAKGSASALVYVTAATAVPAAGGNQTFTFAAGDPMNLNQTAVVLNGTVDDLATTAPTAANSATVSRIRMITYYLDNTIDPTTPRLMRQMNWGDPLVAVNLRARTVAFALENLRFTYDMLDGVTNPSNVSMVAADLTAAGACAPNPCSPNQIRKVNIFTSGRSAQPFSTTRRFFRNSLTTQVSLRSLALVDRYK
jgi:prepilin-type N-terminal cleavage/methylation domain-containing protein